jgi:protein TonB
MKDKDQEKKDKNKALYISIGVHIVLALLFVIIAAWTEPDPPIPEYGIELAIIGHESSPSNDNVKKSKPVVEQEQLEETVLEPKTEEPNTESSEAVSAAELTEDINSPDVNNEVKTTENGATEVEKEMQEVDNIEEANTEEEVKEATTSEPEVDERAIFQDNSENVEGEAGEDIKSGGSSLNMSGWIWDFKPEPDDKSTENGKIVFQITVDEDGEIIGIQTIEKTVSPQVEKVYKNAVMDLTFSKTSDNQSVANNSKGVITFIIQSK